MTRAFTLVELLVVLAILGLLIAIAVPVTAMVRTQGQSVASAANLKQLVTANQNYAIDHGHFAPASDRSNNKRWHGARIPGGAFDPTQGFLADYLGQSRRVTTCPRFASMDKAPNTFEEGTGGYGYNASYIGGTPDWAYDPQGNQIAAHAGSLLRLSDTLMFASTAYARADGIQEYPYAEPPFWDFGNGPSGFRPSPTVHFRFNGRAAIAWADGRVTFEPPQERPPGTNPHGGDADRHHLGWFGPDDHNGFWNPARP
ncbi:MAG: type II secretion system protein [Verrucomicrobiia bacterium]